MASFNFSMEGMEELERDLGEAMKRYPRTMENGLINIARSFKRSAIERTPDGNNHKGDDSTKLRKNFGMKAYRMGMASLVLVYNSAPHFHLVEDGHELISHGEFAGFVPGKHMMEKTRNEYEDIVPERFEALCDQILRGHGL